ncbi:VPA1269 family protein [Aureimonas phyllosphaerae]|uniref:VPA1269 family protein n=1 Tax=Aureimonas phyllosphaerae TaxID=1166078 RepID=UPI003A5C45EA
MDTFTSHDLGHGIVVRSFNGAKPVRINISEEDWFDCADSRRSHLESLLAAIPDCNHRNIPPPTKTVRSPSPQTLVLNSICEAVDGGELLLSPSKFMPARDGITTAAAVWLCEGTALGRSAIPDLTAAGLFDQLKRKKSEGARALMRSHVMRVLASLCMSTNGAECLVDLGAEGIKTWLLHYKSPDDERRWRSDLWPGSEPHYLEALRHICVALGQIFPDDGFENFGRNIRTEFLRKGSENQPYSSMMGRYPAWAEIIDSFIRGNPTVSSSFKGSFHKFILWLHDQSGALDVDNPVAFMTGPRPSVRFIDFLQQKRVDDGKARFDQALLDTLHHVRRLGEHFELMHPQTDAVLQLVTASEIERVKGKLKALGIGQKPVESVSTPLPRDLYERARLILEEGEAGWPGRNTLCYIYPRGVKTYCPVLPTLYIAMFELPLRVAQMKRLDSGEGDLERFDFQDNDWKPNEGPHAGFWRSYNAKRPQRGYAARLPDSQRTGIYVNTNKTGNPYIVPWQNEVLLRLLGELRLFQEKHQPMVAPIEPADYAEVRDSVPEEALMQYPSLFPLFRVPDKRFLKGHYTLPSNNATYRFWQDLMAELERRHNLDHPDDTIVIVKRVNDLPSGQPYGSVFKPHSMRVAGITALAEAGVPITVISKFLAGHETILMTLYYYHLRPDLIHQLCAQAAENMKNGVAALLLQRLRSLDPSPSLGGLVAIDTTVVADLSLASRERRMLISDVEIGLCPWQGTRCHDGGPCVKKQTKAGRDASTHAQVEGGANNCLLCRHFVTGPAWALPLAVHGTNLGRKVARLSLRLEEFEMRRDELTRTGRNLQGEEAILNRAELDRLENVRTALAKEQELLARALGNAFKLLEQIGEISRNEAKSDLDPAGALIRQPDSSFVEWADVSKIEQSAVAHTFGRIYPSLRDEATETATKDLIDRICYADGLTPISLLSLTRDEREEATRAFLSMTTQRLEREELLALESGALRLRDLPAVADLIPQLARLDRPAMLMPMEAAAPRAVAHA